MANKIFWPDWVNILKNIDGLTATEYCHKFMKTYSHVYVIARELESKGLLESQKNGRKVFFQWTAEGKALAEHLSQAINALKEAENKGYDTEKYRGEPQ